MKSSVVFVVLCYCVSLYVMYVRVNKKAQHKSLLWPNLSSTFCPSRQSLLRRIFPRGLFLVRCPDQISFWVVDVLQSSLFHKALLDVFLWDTSYSFRTTSMYVRSTQERVRRRWVLGNRCSWTLYSRASTNALCGSILVLTPTFFPCYDYKRV